MDGAHCRIRRDHVAGRVQGLPQRRGFQQAARFAIWQQVANVEQFTKGGICEGKTEGHLKDSGNRTDEGQCMNEYYLTPYYVVNNYF